SWKASKNTASSSIDVTYEAMHEDAEAVLISILEFCSIPIDLDCVRDAVEFNQFENMKRLEQKKFFSHASMRPMKSAKPEGRKTREGKTGQYMNYLSQSDVDYIDYVMGKNKRK
ncbi:MAG: sulfotransferase domain-containing protein, partial [Hyphomicrobiales bacterium]